MVNSSLTLNNAKGDRTARKKETNNEWNCVFD